MPKRVRRQTTAAMRRPEMRMAGTMGSFADELRASLPRLREVLKLPKWWYFLTYQRRDQAALSQQQRSRFLCALDTLIANGTYGQLVAVHAQNHQMHGTLRFLPWHRVYLLQLENALRTIHPDVTLPYWDWTKRPEQAIPPWLAGVTPTVNTPNGPIAVNRGPGSAADLATYASNVPSVLQVNDFPNFTAQLEGVHNGVHVWVGGSMSSIPTAPADPIFWMHHANIDRLWWQWQTSPNGQGKNPALTGAAAVMDPWPTTEPGTRDIAAMGYTYA